MFSKLTHILCVFYLIIPCYKKNLITFQLYIPKVSLKYPFSFCDLESGQALQL